MYTSIRECRIADECMKEGETEDKKKVLKLHILKAARVEE